jgi:hypothetical protein
MLPVSGLDWAIGVVLGVKIISIHTEFQHGKSKI